MVKDFTRSYDNEEQKYLKPVSNIYKIDESKSAILFPYDIDFEIFCYYVNYLKYPIEIDYSPTVIGWTTTKSDYHWLNDNFEKKQVMLFIDPQDQEYNNVMMTTSDNLQFKLGFAAGYRFQGLNEVIQEYQNRPINQADLNENKSIEIN